MSDGTTKEVPVNWNPSTIDTSIPGTRTAVGTVENFNGKVVYTVIVEAVETGNAQISLYKDSTSSNNKFNFENISNFYIVNKQTGTKYSDGKIPSQSTRKNQFEMSGLPTGEYTIHVELADGMLIREIELGESYKETKYDPETNPLVISSKKTTYVNVVIKTETTLAEINPLEDLIVPANISLEEFKAALPKQTTIIDSSGKEHSVDLKWDIRPFNFESWRKPGEYTVTSEFFTLPVNVSNTEPATRLEVTLNIIFKNIIDPELENAITEAEEAINALVDAVKKAGSSDEAQNEISKAQEKVNKVKKLTSEYDTSIWEGVIKEQQNIVEQMKKKEKEKADQAAAEAVMDQINLLPSSKEIKLEHKGIVEAARKAYGALTTDQQALVTNIAKLSDAEKAIMAIEEAAANEKDVLEAKKALNVTVQGDKLTLVTEGSKRTSIAWKSSDSTYVNASTGNVNRPWLIKKTIKLTATITKGNAKLTQSFTVEVPAWGAITVTKD